jgi:signal transduction histidine kinase/CheY-like chemotaxis protein
MRKVLIVTYTAFLIVLLINFFYYKALYNKQIEYIVELLDRQVRIVGNSVDKTNNGFPSDLNELLFASGDFVSFFADVSSKGKAVERMKLFFSKYQNFATGIKFVTNNKNNYSLRRDTETGEWLEQEITLQAQPVISLKEGLLLGEGIFQYFQPVINPESKEIFGNLVVTVDYKKFFTETFTVFNLNDYQWQWVISDSGEIVYDNFIGDIEYSGTEPIRKGSIEEISGKSIHTAVIKGKNKEIISSYYSTHLLGRNFALVFSAPTEFFQKYIIRNSLFIVFGTLAIIQLIIFIFWRYVKTQNSDIKKKSESENMLVTLIDEMPVGVIIHNRNMEIIKANKVAASVYSYSTGEEMEGKLFPASSPPEGNDYLLLNSDGSFRPDQIVRIRREIGEAVLFKNSIPVRFRGEEAEMEILMDVTLLESARKQEAKANTAKSEFLRRMSFELRTPLNGIIGMTDVLNRYGLNNEVKEMVSLLHRSTEVLLSIINDILDFSRIESGKMILDEIPFLIRAEIGYCIDLARTDLGKNVKLNYSVSDNVPESIIGDPYRLRQILSNLLNHSAANTEAGEILFRCSIHRTEGGILTLGFELLDTGNPFDKAALKKIFGDYINIETKTISADDESGFGTILAKQLVSLMGGELVAQSPSGLSGDLGTKVTFSILTYSNDRPMKDLELEQITTFDKIKTLVITGSQNRDEEFLAALNKAGIALSVTTFTRTTINQVKANISYADDRYKLLIVFDEEEFNGFEAVRQLWENKLSDQFIIILISSNDKKGNLHKSVSLGIDHYLTRPVVPEEVLGRIKGSFPYIEDNSEAADLAQVRTDLKILLVEDNKMNQQVLVTMLKSIGYSCDLAEDGYAGYLQAKTVKYDLIFMDLIMPEMDGYESAQKILSFDKSCLIVAFTADNMPESKKKAELAGIRDFIAKPVRIEELKRLFVRHFKS